jgi:hypothetical protein
MDNKERGSFATPRWFARPLVYYALGPLRPKHKFPSVVDTAVGCGNLLMEAAIHMASNGDMLHAVVNCLFGMDVDPDAVSCCREVLCSLCPEKERDRARAALQEHIQVGDSITHLWARSFDVVLANPPWRNFSVNPGDRVDMSSYPMCASSCRRRLNKCHFFLELSTRLLRPQGRFLFILPESLLQSDMCERVFSSRTERLFRVDGLCTVPARKVWPQLTEQGAIAIFGTRDQSIQCYDYFCARWPDLDSGIWTYRRVNSADAVMVHHLCPHPVWSRVVGRFKTTYASVPWLCCKLGSSKSKPSAEDSTGSILLQKGSVFHLKYICDNFPCFPRKNNVWRLASVPDCAIAAWLLDPSRPDVVAVPLYVDRGHSHRDQLRACFLPPGSIVDDTVSLHWGTAPGSVSYFLLGFWNSTPVEHLLVVGNMTPCSKWFRFQSLTNLPFPDIQIDSVTVAQQAERYLELWSGMYIMIMEPMSLCILQKRTCVSWWFT